MILVLKPDATPEQINHILEHVEKLGFTPYPIRGEFRTVIGIVGDDNKPGTESLNALDGLEQVLPILKPFKLASREFHKADTVVTVGSTKIGGGFLGAIAGPCAVESLEVVDGIAQRVHAAGANLLRGGAIKSRTTPFSVQGLGEEGFPLLRRGRQPYGKTACTERKGHADTIPR